MLKSDPNCVFQPRKKATVQGSEGPSKGTKRKAPPPTQDYGPGSEKLQKLAGSVELC